MQPDNFSIRPREIIDALARSVATSPTSGSLNHIAYHLDWRFGDRRLGDKCYDQVLTIDLILLHAAERGRGILSEMIRLILAGESTPHLPIQCIHFHACVPAMSRLLQRLHFHEYLIGQSVDWWKEMTRRCNVVGIMTIPREEPTRSALVAAPRLVSDVFRVLVDDNSHSATHK